MIERDLSESDVIVGELLQPRGYLKLLELSLEANMDILECFSLEFCTKANLLEYYHPSFFVKT